MKGKRESGKEQAFVELFNVDRQTCQKAPDEIGEVRQLKNESLGLSVNVVRVSSEVDGMAELNFVGSGLSDAQWQNVEVHVFDMYDAVDEPLGKEHYPAGIFKCMFNPEGKAKLVVPAIAEVYLEGGMNE